MLSKNKTYFAPELIEGGHYIITGLSNDNYITDLYQTVDINQVLHQELLDHDFDIVLYYDYLNRLYCYDARSRYLLTHANEPQANQPAGTGSSETIRAIAASGPGGGRRNNRRNRNRAPQVPQTSTYHMRHISIDMAWNHVIALLRQTRYRTAIVFSNVAGLAYAFPQSALDALTALNAVQTDRPHAAFYVFRTESGASFQQYAQIGTGVWTQFFELILKPLFETNDPNKNRVISLSTPNAAEITNLLNMMRLRKQNRLPLPVMTFKKLAEEVAYCCATNSKSLRSLKVSLEEFTKTHPGQPLTLENYQQVLGVKREKTALEEINGLIGLKNVKEWIAEWASSRKDDGMARPFPESASRFYPLGENSAKNGVALNIVFTGKPGTGKSTLAKQIGRLYYELGLLPRGHLVQCSAANIVGQHVGATAPLVRQRVMEAMGGVLMIDEAYALTKNDFGKEAIDQLVNEMTQYAGQFAVVICGYEGPMKAFLAANQGLASRFGTPLHLEDYTPEEMGAIFRKFMAEEDENGMTATMSNSLAEKFDYFCDNWANDHDNKWGNAREASTLLTNMKRRALSRMRAAGQKVQNKVIVLTEADIPSAQARHLKRKPQNINEIIDELVENTIGLKNVISRLIAIAQGIGWDVTDPTAGRYVFHGPPGTGKTHTARRFCNLLFRLGIIKRNFVYEVSAKQLCHPDPEFDYGKRNGERPSISEILEAAFENAKGGVIFIDEAPQLLDDDLGRSVLRALVPIVDRPEIYETTCVILAGYTDKITCLLRDDDGLNRRFPEANRIRFDDYSAEELTQLAKHFAEAQGHVADEEFLQRTRAAFTQYLEDPQENFGNAGFIRDTYIPCAIDRKNARLSKLELGSSKAIASKDDVRNVELQTRSRLTKYDLPDPFDQLAGPPDLPVPPAPTVWERVDRLVGKEEIKEYLRSRQDSTSREQFYDEIRSSENHFAIIGPAGTGRHTAARVIAAVLKELGVIDREQVRITGKGSFEGSFVGHTIPKTLGEIEKTKGGCMVVENPSAMLSRSATDNTYGIEALSTIGGAMSGSTEKLSVIFIDSEEGFDQLSKQMPDIVSKFSRIFHLEDLSPGEMYDLFLEKTKASYQFAPEIRDLLPDFFINWVSQRGDLQENTATWSNGREVDKLVDSLKHYWKKAGGFTDRTTGAPLRVIDGSMFAPQYAKYLTNASADKNKALKELNELTGLEGVKSAVNAIERRLRLYKKTATPGFYAFVGDPGSGKTKVARLFGGILRGTDVLSQGHVIARTAKELADAPDSFEKCLKLAKNGVFFIDEAPQLADSAGGHAVIKKLLTTVEDTDIMKQVCIILAGYEQAMQQLLMVDQGLASRFEKDNAIIRFKNYTPEQLLAILDHFARTADQDPYLAMPYPLDVSDPQFRDISLEIFRLCCRIPDFGNARFVRNYLDKCVNNLLSRVDAMEGTVDKSDQKLLTTLLAEDAPADMRREAQRIHPPSILGVSLLDTQAPGAITADNYAQRIDQIRQSTVLIITTDQHGNQGTGTGTIITKQGHVLTCQHVLRNAASVKVLVYVPGSVGGDYREFDCVTLKPGYGDFDMALCKIEGTNFKALPIRPLAEETSPCEETVMAGFPLADRLNGNNLNILNSTAYDGKICNQQSLPRANMITDIYGLDSSGMPGNSGSAVISKEDGRIIGVFVGAIGNGDDDQKSTHRQNIFFPIKYFWTHFVDFEREP